LTRQRDVDDADWGNPNEIAGAGPLGGAGNPEPWHSHCSNDRTRDTEDRRWREDGDDDLGMEQEQRPPRKEPTMMGKMNPPKWLTVQRDGAMTERSPNQPRKAPQSMTGDVQAFQKWIGF